MYCTQLSMLKDYLSEKQIETLQEFFLNLTENTKNNITVTKIMVLLDIDSKLARKVLMLCKSKGILKIIYAIRCPECGLLVKKYDEIPIDIDEMKVCYSCGEEIQIELGMLELMFSYVDGIISFNEGQLHNIVSINKMNKKVAPTENIITKFIEEGSLDLNHEFFKPTKEEISELTKIYLSVKTSSTNNEKGNTLEFLIQYLFNISKILKANNIKTSTNQLDCFVRNKVYLPYGVFNIIGSRFIIECKNENKTPSGTYMSKIHSILNVVNANSESYVRFGIIASKCPPPKTYHSLAVKYYLSAKIIIISLHLSEIKNIIDGNENLFDMIERKCDEIALDVTTDLKAAGIY